MRRAAAGALEGLFENQPAPMRQAAAQGGPRRAQLARHLRRRGRVERVVLRQRRLEAGLLELAVGALEQPADALREDRAAIARIRPPERREHRAAAGRSDEDLVRGDTPDAPRLRSEQEGVAQRALPDELLVELAEAGVRVLDPQLKVAAIRDRAARLGDEPRRARTGRDRAVEAVEGDSRAELGDPRVGVAPGEHLDHEVELTAGQLVIRRARPQEVVEIVGAPALVRHHADDPLRQQVERRAAPARIGSISPSSTARAATAHSRKSRAWVG